jgi:F-type H+-transporting ATPase subunit epsilon
MALNVDVVATDRMVWSGAAAMVVAPAADGEIGILTGHEPVLSVLRPGSLRIKLTDGSPMSVRVTGGFLSVDSNLVTIVADEVESLDGATPSGAVRH